MAQFHTKTVTFGGVRRWLTAPLVVAALAVGAPASAASVEFADFNAPGLNQPFNFTNNGGTSGTISVSSAPVTFNFTAATGLSTADRQAILTITGTTFTPAIALGGGFLDQRISGPASLSLIEVGTGKNLLSYSFTGDIVGKAGSPNASLSGADTTGDTVTFTSDFLTFMQPGNSYNLSLAGVSPTLSLGPGSVLNTFAANVNGQFLAMLVAVPAPSSVAMLGTGLVAAVVLATQRKRLAKLNRA